jgi:hypothetical protein
MSNEHQILARPPRTRRLQQQDNNQTKTKLKYTCDFAIMFVCSFFRFVQWYQSSENLEQSTLYNVSCPCFFFLKKPSMNAQWFENINWYPRLISI